MINNDQKRALLVENRKEIADEAGHIAQQTKTDFYFKTGLTGGIGTAMIGALAAYKDSPVSFEAGSSVIGVITFSLIGLSFIRASLSAERYTKMSRQAKEEGRLFREGAPVKAEKSFSFEVYESDFGSKHKSSLLPLKSSNLVAIALAFGTAVAVGLTELDNNKFIRKEDDAQDLMDQELKPALIPGN